MNVITRDRWGYSPPDVWQITPDGLSNDRWGLEDVTRLLVCKSFELKYGDYTNADASKETPWIGLAQADSGKEIAWEGYAKSDSDNGMAWVVLSEADSEKESHWTSYDAADDKKAVPWGTLDEADALSGLNWQGLDAADAGKSFLWEKGTPLDWEFWITRHIPLTTDTHLSDTFGNGDGLPNFFWTHKPVDVVRIIPWGNGQALAVPEELPWGQGVPVDTSIFSKGLWLYDRYKKFRLRTKGRKINKRIKLRWIQRILFVINEHVSLIRVHDGEPVNIQSGSVETDINSWNWTANFSLSSRSDAQKIQINALAPDVTGPVEVELNVNNYLWRFMIDSVSESVRYGEASYSCKGVSKITELGPPGCKRTTKTWEEQTKSIHSLVEDLLMDTEWTVVWDSTGGWDVTSEWDVPADTYSIEDKTVIEAIGDIVKSVGGIVQADPVEKIIKLYSRFPFSPKTWGDNISLFENLELVKLFSDNQSWQPSPKYNYIAVSGTTTDGAAALVIREGTDTDPVTGNVRKAGEISDPLMLTHNAIQERGRVELDLTGYDRIEHQFDMPLPGKDLFPSLLLPPNMAVLNTLHKSVPVQIERVSVSFAIDDKKIEITQSLTASEYQTETE